MNHLDSLSEIDLKVLRYLSKERETAPRIWGPKLFEYISSIEGNYVEILPRFLHFGLLVQVETQVPKEFLTLERSIYAINPGIGDLIRKLEESEAARPPQWVTIKQIYELAKSLSPSSALSLPRYRSELPKLLPFERPPGRKSGVAKYHDLLPKLQDKWPEIQWPSQLSNQ